MRRALPVAARGFDRLAQVVSAACTVAATAAVLWLIFATVLDIGARAVMGRGLTGVVDLSAVVVVAVIFLGLGRAQRDRVHVAITLLVTRLPRAVGEGLVAAGLVAGAAFLAWLLWAAAGELAYSYSVGEYRIGITRLPLWPARAMIVVGFSSLLLEVLNDLLQSAAGRRPLVARRDAALADSARLTASKVT